MKVFAYMPTPGGLTGAPRRLLTLASVLRDQGIEMCIATQRDSELFRAAEELGLKTVAVEPVGVLRERHGALFGGNAIFRLKALFSLLVQNLGIARKIRRHGADVVWIRSSKGIAFAGLGALLSRRPLVWDVDYELPSRGPVRWLHRLGLWAAKRVVFQYSAAPDAIFGPGLAGRYRQKFKTIIPGIDLPSLEPFRAKRMARECREGDPFVILQVGTICDRKNQQLLIDALVRVRQARPNGPIRVQLAGGVFEEDYAGSLKEKVTAAGLEEEVEFLGWRSDVHELMAGADVLAMPSRDEGVPNTVQEAMAIGLPVLASEAGGMPEVVTEGETGWILGMDSAESWADRIGWCLENRKQLDEVGQRAAEYAVEHFGTQQWGSEYGRLIAESCGGGE
ncbi:glycosyltransferase family 4 protein [Thioalkalivibrio sp. ALE19]|uniref:glycosyltransferase family 4 protein n=1 Tax=Thioalkalivibrio sp. ALE19 TaxID=1266909 RepID=UPI0004102FAD|nr:glycosyltransferase family 4 protein [Thioalkalivibrio sp. ALE19]